MAMIIAFSVLVLSLFGMNPLQGDPNSLPWYGWALLGVLAAFALYLALKKQTPEELVLRAEAEEAKAEALLEDAQELLKTGEGVEVVRVIEHDLDGIDGPETLQVVRTRIVEDDSMTVVHTVEQISSALDGDIMQQTIETLDVNTARLDATHVQQSAESLAGGIVSQAESLAVDSEGVDMLKHTEALFDAVQGEGLISTERTMVDDQTGDAVLEEGKGLLEAEEPEAGEAEEEGGEEA